MTDEDVMPQPGDQWCGHCKRWVARHHVSLSHTHDGCSDEGCGYQVYAQDHPCFRGGFPIAERPQDGNYTNLSGRIDAELTALERSQS